MEYSLLKDEELVALCKSNDDKAFSVLTERYISASGFHASRFRSDKAERDDLVQEGMLGFIAAVYAYNENAGAAFSTFANQCIKNRILSAVRAANSKKHIPSELTVPFEAHIVSTSGELNPEERFIFQEETERIALLIEHELSKKERTVFRLFLQGLHYEQIAEACCCTVKSVDGTMQRVRKKLRENLS